MLIILKILSYLCVIAAIFLGYRSLLNKRKDLQTVDCWGLYKGSYKATFTEKGWKFHKLAILFAVLGFFIMAVYLFFKY
jgi:hypothetical protein